MGIRGGGITTVGPGKLPQVGKKIGTAGGTTVASLFEGITSTTTTTSTSSTTSSSTTTTSSTTA